MESKKQKKNKGDKKGKGGEDEEKKSGSEKLKTCTFVKARHILCEKLSKI